jgi:hypothetical protein
MNAKLNFQSKHKENRLFCTRFIRFLIALAAMTVSTTSAWGETKSIKYLTYSGGAITEAAYPVDAEAITSGSNNLSGWYYVEGNVTISSTVTLSGDTHLILCDGATLTINVTGSDYGIKLDDDLTIYAQSSGSHAGKLIINGVNNGIFGNLGNITINGGIISVTSTSERGVWCANFIVNGGNVNIDASANERIGIVAKGNITVNGGNLSATGGAYAIWTYDVNNVTINGGQVYAKGGTNGVWSRGTVNLGWTNVEDYIRSSGYDGTGSINTLKDFYIDGSTTLATANNISSSIINGKKLTPNPTTASYTISLGEGITGGTVEVDRTKAFAGERVAITVTPPTGKILASLTYNDGTNTYTIGTYSPYITRQANDYVITMPAANVTVNATFVTPVAQIGDTKYPTLQAAFDAVPNGGATTIDILRDITEATTARGDWVNPNITLNLNGKDVTIGGMTSLASLSIYGNGGKMTVKNNLGISNSNGDNADQLLIDKATIIIEDGIQWMAEKIKLQNNAKVTIYNNFGLGYSTEELSVNIDNGSWMKLISCAIGATNGDQAKAALLPLVCPDLREAFTVPGTYGTASEPYYLRGSWGIELKNGLSNATTTFYEAPSTFDPDAEFAPSAYTTSTTYIDNSDGLDHYVIAHIVPADGYWTDEKLLSHTESGASITGTPVSDLKMVKREQYNGAGWYWYKLPKAYSVAAGYTTSTLGGEVVPQFDLDETKGRVSQSGNVVTVTDGTSDGWKAKLTFDKVSFKFDGNVLTPAITDITILYGTTEKLSADDAAISKHIITDGDETIGRHWIGLHTAINLPGGGMEMLNGWFKSACWDANQAGFDIIVPFSGSGTGVDPWQISTANELNLLAKCVNIGKYDFSGKFLEQKADIGMGSVTDFLPIGCLKTDFKGSYDGKGKTISSLNTVQTTVNYTSDNYGEYMTVGLFGTVGASGVIKDVKLSSCTFSDSKLVEASIPVEAIGAVAGILNSGAEVSGCTVSGTSGTTAGSYTGAIFGKLGTATLTKNYYDYTTTATLGSSTASGYTKRGIWDGTKWDDATTNDGAVLWVKKATISETKPTGSTSSVAFSQKTTPDLADATHPANCYKIGDDGNYYAVNQPITLTVTEGQSKADGLRTFYDGLSGLTVNGSSDGVDLANRSFSMPEADAEIAATFTPSNWFTIPSNGKKWMSFYHVWKDANNAPENYTVSDYNTAGAATPKTIEVKTITAADSKTGEVTFGSLEGVSYSGMPTLFHCETVLPDVLKFTPNTTATTTVTPATQFIGVATATQLSGDGIYVMNGDGDFIWASDTSEKLGAHKCYVNLGKAAGRRLTVISDDNATGIHSIDNGPSTMDDADGAWYSIDGRKLQGKPTKKGLYIYKGKKTVIK